MRDPSNRLSSTRFGSINRNFTSSGRARNSTDAISALRQTLLPEFVAPAMSRCGIVAKSAIIGWPEISRPSANEILDLARSAAFDSMISRRWTNVTSGFGTSIPITPFPGTGASTLTASAFSA